MKIMKKENKSQRSCFPANRYNSKLLIKNVTTDCNGIRINTNFKLVKFSRQNLATGDEFGQIRADKVLTYLLQYNQYNKVLVIAGARCFTWDAAKSNFSRPVSYLCCNVRISSLFTPSSPEVHGGIMLANILCNKEAGRYYDPKGFP